MKIAYDAKRYYHNQTGLGNYSRTLVGDVSSMYADDVEVMLYDCKTWERTFRLGRKAAKDGCTLFHGLSNELPRDIVRSAVPSIVTMHDVAWRTYPAMYKPWDRLIYDWKYGWSARHATHVVCISEATKREVMRYYHVPEERISVIYQPVAPLYYTPMGKNDADDIIRHSLPYLHERSYILTVGSINSRKNLMNMVKAYATLPSGERPMFIVVGNGREYRHKVEAYINEKGLQDDIRIESNIHDAQTLQALYTRTLLLMYPSFCEGFGLPVVEASLQCCPVITSNISSLPEAAGPAAVQCNPASVQELADALHMLLRNTEERTRRGIQAREYCLSMFNPDELTCQMFNLYKKVSTQSLL